MFAYPFQFRRRLTAAACSMLASTTIAHAQANDRSANVRRTYVPVTVAIVDDAPGTPTDPVIFRRTAGDDRDVIVLPRSKATATRLGAAVETLLFARAADADTATRDAMIRTGATSHGVGMKERDWRINDAMIARLLRGPSRMVAGIGLAKAGTLYLRANALRGKTHRQARSGAP